MHILAISGSLRTTSTTSTLARAAAALTPENTKVTIYNDLGDLPHFSPDIDDDKSPAAVLDLRRQLQAADGVLICTPEYAFGMPGSLKNALDWTVSTGDFDRKPVATISASPLYTGGEKALASLLLTLQALHANVVEGGTLSIPSVRKKLAASGELTDAETEQAVKAVMAALTHTIEADGEH